MHYRLNVFFWVLALVGLPCALLAQVPKDGQSLDRIVAVVGKEVILFSDVEGRTQLLLQQSPQIGMSQDQLREKVLESLVNEKLLVMKAMEDSITAGDDEVNQRLDYTIENMKQAYGTISNIEAIYGMSLDRIKRDFREEIRKQLLAERLQQQRFGSVKASRKDVEDFYQQYRDSLPMVPSQYDIAHIVVYVKASQIDKTETESLARRVRDSIIRGGSFEDFAKRYSGDPGSAAEGGKLPWIEKGKLVPEYERTAYGQQPGDLSEPVESPFGFHLIETLEKKKDQILTRHILFKVGRSASDNERAKELLLSVKRRVEAGERFDSLAKIYSEEKETQGFGGSMGLVDVSALPGDLKEKIAALSDGGVSDPLPYVSDPSKPAYHIVQRKRMVSEHKASLENDYKKVEQMATQMKQSKLLEAFVQELRKTLYWEVKR